MSSLVILYPLLLALAIVIPMYLLDHLPRKVTSRRWITCPVSGRRVHVEILSRVTHHQVLPLRVKACSSFSDPRKVQCPQECLKAYAATGPPPRTFRRCTA